ncbi:hypothetical protein [Sphingomonas sp. Leaf25]|uniref:hypothetical protein n=1 Tax=Sphingomonas sp. Leaf25 TaxID=1735692 RepID=UPI0006FA2D39|nr:hypothetical protein [Sphingomonas sp. Leaf25]KQN07255.1 hypothetical protein ASE78_13680 [Sphingomonas sp. Leaf25]
MQDSGTTPLQSPGVLGVLTTAHFVLIAVLMVLTIVGIAYGMKLARRRREGTRELEEAGHLERTGDGAVDDPDALGEAVAARDAVPASADGPGRDTADVVQVAGPVRDEARTVAPAPAPIFAPVAVPVAAPVAAPVAPVADATDLTLLKGLGPKVAAMLVDRGIADIAALARLDDAQADDVAATLGTFAPRMARDRWVEQARYLAAGDKAGFEAVFGKL